MGITKEDVIVGSVLAIDYGLKKIGLAVSDEERIFAFPHSVIENKNFESVLNFILDVVCEKNVDLIIIGMPFNMDGSKGSMAKNVDAFMEKMKKKINIPIQVVDERLSSFMANENLKESGLSSKVSKEYVDKEAARIMLGEFIENSHKS